MTVFVIASLAAWLLVVVGAARFRSRAYATFRGVALAIHIAIASAVFGFSGRLAPVFVYLHATLFVQALALVRPRMRPVWYRVLVSIPSSFFAAGTFLALPWAIAVAFGAHASTIWIPYAAAFIGVLQSLSTRMEEVDVVVSDGHVVKGVRRHTTNERRAERPLRIVQLTDTHLGPFMSVQRLRRICERAVSRRPDLVFLTGDFLTMESQADPALLSRALEPLSALRGKVFACFGNHDHEAPETVRRALDSIGAKLLVDEAAEIETPAGRVQIVGMDFVWRDRAAHLRRACEAWPRSAEALRIVLLHDPGAFRHLPEGQADLVLSGHTHGGQIGLVSLGLPWTMLRVLMNAPDHGLWARGTDRLYVHRGTGHYGFPLRLGVPAEESLLLVHGPDAR